MNKYLINGYLERSNYKVKDKVARVTFLNHCIAKSYEESYRLTAGYNFISSDHILAINEQCVIDKVTALSIAISSPGGNAFEAFAIINQLKKISDNGIKIIIENIAICASAAGMIFISADERRMLSGAQLMLHKATGFVYGNEDQIKAGAIPIANINKYIFEKISTITGATYEDIEKRMIVDNWYNGFEAFENNLATHYEDSANNIFTKIKNAVNSTDKINLNKKYYANFMANLLKNNTGKQQMADQNENYALVSRIEAQAIALATAENSLSERDSLISAKIAEIAEINSAHQSELNNKDSLISAKIAEIAEINSAHQSELNNKDSLISAKIAEIAELKTKLVQNSSGAIYAKDFSSLDFNQKINQIIAKKNCERSEAIRIAELM